MMKSERILTNILLVINILIWATIGGIYLYPQQLEDKIRIEERVDLNENNIVNLKIEKECDEEQRNKSEENTKDSCISANIEVKNEIKNGEHSEETDYIQETRISYNIGKIGDVDSKFLKEAEEVVSAIPSDIYNIFIEDGFNIYITTENIAQVYCNGQYKSVRAVFRRYAKDIVVEDREEAIWGSIEHEFGHYIDMKNGDISLTEEYAYSIIDKSKCTPKALELINKCLKNITPVEESN